MDEVFEHLEGHISPVECLYGTKTVNGRRLPHAVVLAELDEHMRMFLRA